MLAICVNCGIGTPADERLARRYYLWAAGEGVIEAMVAAAEMLLNGRGGRADPGGPGVVPIRREAGSSRGELRAWGDGGK